MDTLGDEHTQPRRAQFFAAAAIGPLAGGIARQRPVGRQFDHVAAFQAQPFGRRHMQPHGIIVDDLGQVFLRRRAALRVHIPFEAGQDEALGRQRAMRGYRAIGRHAVVLDAQLRGDLLDLRRIDLELARRRGEAAHHVGADLQADRARLALGVGPRRHAGPGVDLRAGALLLAQRLACWPSPTTSSVAPAYSRMPRATVWFSRLSSTSRKCAPARLPAMPASGSRLSRPPSCEASAWCSASNRLELVMGLTSTTSASGALEISSSRLRAKALTITTMGCLRPAAARRISLAVASPSMPAMCQSASTMS